MGKRIAPGGHDPPVFLIADVSEVDRDLRARWETLGGEAASHEVFNVRACAQDYQSG